MGLGEGGQVDVPERAGSVAVSGRTRSTEAPLPRRRRPRLYRGASNGGRDETDWHERRSTHGGVCFQAVVKVPAKEPTHRGESTPNTCVIREVCMLLVHTRQLIPHVHDNNLKQYMSLTLYTPAGSCFQASETLRFDATVHTCSTLPDRKIKQHLKLRM